ncbi:MAG TPA: dipicolinate synthase subunit B, partial [Firmicutes bacterium]|nr:dipicolinate synthase subunit B [Bacillota bacterium]
MDLTGKIIGLALTGSHCTISEVYPQIKELIAQG